MNIDDRDKELQRQEQRHNELWMSETERLREYEKGRLDGRVEGRMDVYASYWLAIAAGLIGLALGAAAMWITLDYRADIDIIVGAEVDLREFDTVPTEIGPMGLIRPETAFLCQRLLNHEFEGDILGVAIREFLMEVGILDEGSQEGQDTRALGKHLRNLGVLPEGK